MFIISRENRKEYYVILALLYMNSGVDPKQAKQSAEQALATAVRCGLSPVVITSFSQFRDLKIPMESEAAEQEEVFPPPPRMIGPWESL